MKICVTGGAGFIGSHLCEELVILNHQVVIIDNLFSGKLENIKHIRKNVEFVKGDIRDKKLLLKHFKKADRIIHLGAIPSVPRSIREICKTHDVNVNGTLNVFECAKLCGVKRVVYASSSAVYGNSTTLPKRENMECFPISPYGWQKFSDEFYAKMYSLHYGLETIGLRYFNVFGTRQDPNSEYSAVIPKFMKLMKHNKRPIIYGDGSVMRDFTHVKNVVAGTVLACIVPDIGREGDVYNIACGKMFSLKELVDNINFVLKKRIVPIYEAPRDGDIKESLASIMLAQRKLKYRVIVPFKLGLLEMVDYY